MTTRRKPTQRFLVEVEIENDAMQSPAEIARFLRRIAATEIESYDALPKRLSYSSLFLDGDGNTTHWKMLVSR